MGEELVRTYLRSKVSFILNEADAEGDAPGWMISRFRSIERSIMNSKAPIEALYDLIHELSECRVFVSKSAAFKKGFFYWFRVLWFKKNMTSRLDRIEERLLNNPSPPPPNNHNRIQRPTSCPMEDPSLIIGFESEAQKIEGWLLGEDKRVGIVGRCGVGKTALAQKVFSSPKIREEFSPRIWVCLSNTTEVEESRYRVLNYILKKIGGDQDGGGVEELQSRLMGKRYLIVLDDVWQADDWYANIFLPGGAVIATGRREDVIRRTVEGEVIRMGPILSDETCWRIFSDAVERQHKLGMQNVLRIRTEQEITEYCHGLPLAANALATVFANPTNFELWIPARQLYIAWGNATSHWTWISFPPPRVEEVAVLIRVWWLEIRGRLELRLLLKTYYSAYLVFKLKTEGSSGLSEPMMSQVGFPSKGEKIPLTEDGTRVVFLNNVPRGEEEEEGGERCLPQLRDNEWMEIKLGEFFNNVQGPDDDKEVEAALYEVQHLNPKSGLIVKGILFRPNYI